MNSIHGLVPGDKVKVRSWNSMKTKTELLCTELYVGALCSLKK